MYVVVYFIVTSLFAYSMMWKDKKAAINKDRRISEKFLFMVALMGGGLGIYWGMKAPLYHKAAKTNFKVGIPFIVIVQGLTIAYFNYFYNL